MIGSRKVKHDARNAQKQGWRSRGAHAEERQTVHRLTTRADNALHVKDITDLLEDPSLRDSVRNRLTGTLQFLKDNPHKNLLAEHIDYIKRVRYILDRDARLRREGKEVPVFVSDPTKRKKVSRHTKAARPAWMDDPALLPKKPPGRA